MIGAKIGRRLKTTESPGDGCRVARRRTNLVGIARATFKVKKRNKSSKRIIQVMKTCSTDKGILLLFLWTTKQGIIFCRQEKVNFLVKCTVK